MRCILEKKYNYIRKTEVFEGHRYEGRGKTEAEAYKKLHAKIEAAKRGELGISPNMKVSAWADIWLKDYIAPRVRKPGEPKLPHTMSKKNYRMYEQCVRLYIKPQIGNKKLADVTEPNLRRILNEEKGTSFSHVSKLRIVIKAMFSQAFASRIIPYDPAALLEMPAAEKGKRRSLTEEEKRVFYETARKNKHGPLFRFLVATGMRPNEVRALKVKDLDLEKGIVQVRQAVESGTSTIADPKTAAGKRYTVINDKDLISWLDSHIIGKDADDFVFTQEKDKTKMLTETCFKRYWESFCRDMDLAMGAETNSRGHIYDPTDLDERGRPIYPDPADPTQPRNGHKISPDLVTYCLRHTFGTDMQRQNVPIDVTKYLMGHSDISTTANIYVDSGKPEAIRAVEVLFPQKPDVGNSVAKKSKSRKKQEKSTGIATGQTDS